MSHYALMIDRVAERSLDGFGKDHYDYHKEKQAKVDSLIEPINVGDECQDVARQVEQAAVLLFLHSCVLGIDF